MSDATVGAASVEPKRLLVIGAGPKAAAIAAKNHALATTRKGNVALTVVDLHGMRAGAFWTGAHGFTDGKRALGTPPAKDVGYPYLSRWGTAVDLEMLRYSWQAFLITSLGETAYSDWVDRGCPHPTHSIWANYLNWVFEKSETPIVPAEVIAIELEANGQVQARMRRRHREETKSLFDGVVLTGPGKPIRLDNEPIDATRIFDGRSYWKQVALFSQMPGGEVAVIGSGETAAIAVVSLLECNPNIKVTIISRHGAPHSRGESYLENRRFSHPLDWQTLKEPVRNEFMRRTDRGVFSVEAHARICQSDRVKVISAEVGDIDLVGDKVELTIDYAGHAVAQEFDKVIVALGFDAWSPLDMVPAVAASLTDAIKTRIQSEVDEQLRIPPAVLAEAGLPSASIHVPMLAALSQGPGFPNLSCLGHVSDRILATYLP